MSARTRLEAGAPDMSATTQRTARTPRHTRLSDQDLAELVRRAARGDRGSWEILMDEFSGMVWAVARAHRLHDADAADVAQSTWLRLLEHLGRLHDPARVGAWLATTARPECLRTLRDAGRMVPFGEDAPEVACSEPPPGEALLEQERDDALWRSFARLRANDQALLRLLVADPRPSYAEIAAALDIPIGSIGPTRQRALERLRRELAAQGTLELMID